MPILAIILLLPSLCQWKVGLILNSILFSVIGAVLTGLQTNDSDACVSFRAAGVIGTIFTALGIMFAAVTSFPS